MAAKLKRWAVRDIQKQGGWYRFGEGRAPTLISTPAGFRWQDTAGTEQGCVPPAVFERRVHKWFHLPPGGGPVLIEYKHEA